MRCLDEWRPDVREAGTDRAEGALPKARVPDRAARTLHPNGAGTPRTPARAEACRQVNGADADTAEAGVTALEARTGGVSGLSSVEQDGRR